MMERFQLSQLGWKRSYGGTENLWTAVAASILVPRPSAELDVPTNFDAISKNVKIVQIGPVGPKLWKFCENGGTQKYN